MHQKGVNMYYRYLGKTGMKVSELCLGAMTFGRESSEDISRQMMDRFAAAGCGYFLMNPIGDPADERDQIEAIAADILPRLASR